MDSNANAFDSITSVESEAMTMEAVEDNVETQENMEVEKEENSDKTEEVDIIPHECIVVNSGEMIIQNKHNFSENKIGDVCILNEMETIPLSVNTCTTETLVFPTEEHVPVATCDSGNYIDTPINSTVVGEKESIQIANLTINSVSETNDITEGNLTQTENSQANVTFAGTEIEPGLIQAETLANVTQQSVLTDITEDVNVEKVISNPVEAIYNGSSISAEQIIETKIIDGKTSDADTPSTSVQTDCSLSAPISRELQESNVNLNADISNETATSIGLDLQESNVEVNADESNKNTQENITNDQEIAIDQNEVIQENVNEVLESTHAEIKQVGEVVTIEEQIESIHESSLDNENNELITQECSNIASKIVADSKVIDIDQDLGIQENIGTGSATESTTLNMADRDDNIQHEIITNVTDKDSIEKQVSSIVEHEESSSTQLQSEKSISIAEAISRDFDETDSEDIDKPDTVELVKSTEVEQDDVVVGVRIGDQIQHGSVTVQDTSGQIYYVQSVEDLVMVDNNDMSSTLENPDTYEVTVLSDIEDSVQMESNEPKIKARPSIPSHILGRNIENPVVDTFRNGKVPPKPRLGVKIPYKNLTSQIVSKDEIAKEILERQKQKYKQSGQTTREILFAKKLTQRLAKKIAPAPTSTTKATTTTVVKSTEETINNSDLLAILEGDGEDAESRKNVDIKAECSSKRKVGDSTETKNIEKNPSVKSDGRKKIVGPTVVSKLTEKEIALKQLNELPAGPIRRRKPIARGWPSKKGSNEPELRLIVDENELIVDDKCTRSAQQEKIPQPIVNKLTEQNIKSGETTPKQDQKKTTELSVETTNRTCEVTQPAEVPEPQQNLSTTLNKSDKVKENESIQLESKKNTETETIIEKTKASNTKLSLPVSTKETSAVNTKTKDKEKKQVLEAVAAPDPTQAITLSKVDEVKSLTSPKINDNTKKNDISVKSVPVKVVESDKVSDKIDTSTTDIKEEFVERKHTTALPVKTYTRKRKSSESTLVISNVPDKKPVLVQKDAIPPNTYITKSSRIIKRKVIWDPDEPSTARSLPMKSPKAEPSKTEKTAAKLESNTSKVEKKPLVKSEIIKSPVKSPDSQKNKKRLTEVDKLLMDEGAVNMLYAFKTTDDLTKKKKSSVISLDKAQRELLNKTNELKKDLKTNSDKVSPKALRKKDSPVPTPTKKAIPASISRKKSKDSNRSSLHSPPASPGMVYLNHAEASRIIRRHSSSSYSSLEELDMEKDVTITPSDSEKVNKKRNAPLSTEGTKAKKTKRSIDKENLTVVEKSKTTEETLKKLAENEKGRDFKYKKYKTFSVKETDHMVQIILLPSFNNEAYLTPEILSELCSIMKELKEDTNCTVVLVSSSASSFCHGINYRTLLSDKEQSRKAFARKLASHVTNFLKILATFPKILIAGVHGDTVGLGVTVLPLFDMVIASDTATFNIPNARLGCAVEGGSLLSLPHLMHNVLVSELLYASRKLIAAEALRLGMVTRVLWPDKFQQELVSIVKSISNHSSQFMELTKKQLRQHMMQHIEEPLNNEVDTLVEHWTSLECQRNFGVYG